VLRVADLVPHFTVHDLRGPIVSYKDIWQRQNLLLLMLCRASSNDAAAYLARLQAHMTKLADHDTAVVITTESVEGLSATSVMVADRWGEIHWIADAGSTDEMPAPSELIDWLRCVQMRCPECEGETK